MITRGGIDEGNNFDDFAYVCEFLVIFYEFLNVLYSYRDHCNFISFDILL